jgi:hypothetical protein
MRTYYTIHTGKETVNAPTWREAKKTASAALKNGIYPVEILQIAMIDGKSTHHRYHVLIESPEESHELVKSGGLWGCIDSFYRHVRPSRNL